MPPSPTTASHCFLTHGLVFALTTLTDCDLFGCWTSKLRSKGLAALDIECVRECVHKGPCALDKEQEVLWEHRRMCTKILAFQTVTLSAGLEGQSWTGLCCLESLDLWCLLYSEVQLK